MTGSEILDILKTAEKAAKGGAALLPEDDPMKQEYLCQAAAFEAAAGIVTDAIFFDGKNIIQLLKYYEEQPQIIWRRNRKV